MENSLTEDVCFSREVIFVHCLTEFIEEEIFLPKRESIKLDRREDMYRTIWYITAAEKITKKRVTADKIKPL
jgi:hypothetical protein